jgi:hypothetical protein
MDTMQLIRGKRNDLLVTCQKICPLPDTVEKLVHENSSFNALEWIQSEGSPLTTEERQITQEYDASELSALVARNELTATQVVSAFVKAAALAHQLVCQATSLPFQIVENVDRQIVQRNSFLKLPSKELRIWMGDSSSNVSRLDASTACQSVSR